MAPQQTSCRPGVRVLARGEAWSVAAATPFADCCAVALRGTADTNINARRTLLTPFDRFRSSLPAARLRLVRPRRWVHAVRRAACDSRPFGGLTAAAESSIELLPYQLEPALAVLRHGASRLLIADGVGLGKTIQAGLLLAELVARDEGTRALVLTPAGLRGQWARELASRFALETTIADSAWLAATARELPPDVNPWLLPRTYVASYDFVKRPEVLHAIEDLTWDVVVIDEAHNATRGSARFCAVNAVALRARHVILLTATPHSGDAADFDALCGIGAPDPKASRILFFQRSHHRMPGQRRRTVMLAVRPTHAERRMHRLLEAYGAAVCREAASRGDLQARLAVVVLRKRALSSGGSLAISVRRRLDLLSGGMTIDGRQLALPLGDEDPLDDDPQDAVLGAPGLADVPHERRLLERVLNAAEETARAESKIARMRRFITRIGEPAIVFTEYRDTLARLRGALQAAGIHAIVLHGGQGAVERDAVQQQFNRDGGVLLATDAAAEGLNLHSRCRTIVHFELPWSPGRLEQRAGRVDRIGQRRRVHEIAFVAADTAERLVLVPLVRRAMRARRDLQDNGAVLPLLTESHTAAAVLDGVVHELPQVPIPAEGRRLNVPEPLGTDAAIEVERLRLLRTWRASRTAPVHRRHRSTIPLAVLTRSKLQVADGLVFVLAIELASGSGRVVHSQVACVHLPPCAALNNQRIPAIAADVAGALERYGEAVRKKLIVLLADELDAIAAAHQRRTSASADRERTLLARAVSASRQLVQAGLFDSRDVRRHRVRLEANAHSVADSERRLFPDTGQALSRSAEIVAVLLVRRGRVP